MIRRVQKAKKMSERVQWHFQQDNGSLVMFDPVVSLLLEEALDNKQQFVKIKINNQVYKADVVQRKAFSADDVEGVVLQRTDMKGQFFCLLQNRFHVHTHRQKHFFFKELPAHICKYYEKYHGNTERLKVQ